MVLKPKKKPDPDLWLNGKGSIYGSLKICCTFAGPSPKKIGVIQSKIVPLLKLPI
tara:strand:+ start:379 stop:543 length:165 start_codon:yes stop_codon:yes gene_type:complete